jgi:ABC-type nitrate/sulfonate/bicarbonate transport system permease component
MGDLLIGRYVRLNWALSPYVSGLYATPTVALLPVLSLWLGLYVAPKLAIVVLLAIFPVIKNTYAGVATVGHELLEPASSMQASEFQIARYVIAPAILPFVMAGLRLSVGRGIVGLVVGEFFTAQTGLGCLLIRYASNFRTTEMFVPIFVLVAFGYGLWLWPDGLGGRPSRAHRSLEGNRTRSGPMERIPVSSRGNYHDNKDVCRHGGDRQYPHGRVAARLCDRSR